MSSKSLKVDLDFNFYYCKKNNNDKKKVAEVLDYVASSGGIEYAIEYMHQYHQQAKTIIGELPATGSKDEILGLVDFVINRKK